ncbi:MAG: Ig-like domain-containing protein [Methanomassiliicoccales archaeon]
MSAVGPSAPAPPVVAIDTPTNNSVTHVNYVNVTWTVTGLTSNNNWNWTRTYLVGSTPGEYTNVSHSNFNNITFTANGNYQTDVFNVNKTGSGYLNSTVTSVVYSVQTFANITILFPVAGGFYNTPYVLGHWNVTNIYNGVANISVKLDTGAYQVINWDTTKNFTGLLSGAHTITVRAISNGTAHYTNNASVAFTIDLVAPTVTAFQPSGSAVPLTTSMVITFSEEMNKNSVAVAVTPTPSGIGAAAWSNGNKTVTYFLQSAASTSYSVTVSGKDLAGNALTGTVVYTYSSLNHIIGVVTDSNNNVLSGANVTISSTLAGGPTYYTTTSDTGAISVLVGAGTYNVKVTLSNYNELDQNGVAFGPGLATNNLGTLKMTGSTDWTLVIIIIVIGIIIIAALAAVMVMRRR